MKILRIIGSADPRGGGPIEGILRSSAAMAELGHVNEILAPDLPTDPWVREAPLRTHAVGRVTKRYAFSPSLTDWLLDNAESYDAAIIHGLWNYSSVGAWRALRRRRTPYFVFPHGMLDPWFLAAQPVKGAAKRAYWALLESRVLAGAKRTLFTSEEERRLARETFPGPWRDAVVAYGTAAPPPSSAIQLRAFRDKAPTLGERPFLLFLSRIHPKKGCDLLVEAFAGVAAAHPDLQLVIAGPDQVGWQARLTARAEELGISERIHWPGMLSGDAKWGAFHNADAFVLPSHQENFGIVVAEAMACGRPVLITRNVNIWAEVTACGAGLAEQDDQAGVDRLLQQFLALPAAARQAMGAAASRCFAERFEIGRSARDILAQLEAGHA